MVPPSYHAIDLDVLRFERFVSLRTFRDPPLVGLSYPTPVEQLQSAALVIASVTYVADSRLPSFLNACVPYEQQRGFIYSHHIADCSSYLSRSDDAYLRFCCSRPTMLLRNRDQPFTPQRTNASPRTVTSGELE